MLQAEGRRNQAESGAIAVLMAISLAVIMGFAALGFDLAYVRLARLQMQNASDAAAHAAIVNYGLTRDVSLASTAAVTVANANTVLGRPVQLQSGDVVFGVWDFSQPPGSANSFSQTSPFNAVSVNARRSDTTASDGFVSLSFGRAMGFTQANVARTSIGAFRTRDMIIEMDVTGSFILDNGCFNNDIDYAISADVNMLDYMSGLSTPSDQIGMDVFVGNAVEFTKLQNLQKNYSAIRNQWVGDGKSSLDTSKRSGLTICNKIGAVPPPNPPWPNHSWMPHCWDGGEPGFYAGTNQAAAIDSAVSKLPKDDATRAIVLVTDGSPMCCMDQEGGGCADGTSCTDGSAVCACAKKVYNDGFAAADSAAAKGIDIFTVVFGGTSSGIKYCADLVRGRGKAYNTPDKTRLKPIMEDIAGRLPVALVR